MQLLLLFSVFVIATCGLIYELIASTLASYLLGDSVMQFSTVIGTYLFSMGIGSFLSKYITKHIVRTFVQVELLIALTGGFSSILLFYAFERTASFRFVLYGNISLVGILVGVEIPLLMRLMQERYEFKDLVSNIFTYDYVGALVASLAFPMVLVPHLGLIRSSLLFGLFNAGVATWTLALFDRDVVWAKAMKASAIGVIFALAAAFAYAEPIMQHAESGNYPDPVVFAKSTPYQRMVITRAPKDVRLFLNNNLQFSTRDEYRYHEALVHVGMASVPSRQRILILGGGDGMAAREVLKYPDVESITLVDLDAEMTSLFRDQDELAVLNGASFRSPRVKVINGDAYQWLRQNDLVFDFAILDFPDPSNYSLGKLFSTSFYKELRRHLTADGAAVIQSTSPFVARRAYWCVNATLDAVGFSTLPYHTLVPSFGDWGFVLASMKPLKLTTAGYPSGLRYLTPEVLAQMVYFPKDVEKVETGANRLDNQLLVRYFEEEWSEYAR